MNRINFLFKKKKKNPQGSLAFPSCMHECLVAQSRPTLSTPWTAACHAPLSMGLSRQEYWSGLPCLPPGDPPNPRIEPMFPALAGRFFTAEPLGKPDHCLLHSKVTESVSSSLSSPDHFLSHSPLPSGLSAPCRVSTVTCL